MKLTARFFGDLANVNLVCDRSHLSVAYGKKKKNSRFVLKTHNTVVDLRIINPLTAGWTST